MSVCIHAEQNLGSRGEDEGEGEGEGEGGGRLQKAKANK